MNGFFFRHPALRFPVRATAVAAALAGLALLPVRAWVGAPGVTAVLLASAVALVGALVGHAAGRLLPRGRPEAPAQAAFLSMGVRLLLTTVLAFVALSAVEAPAHAFALVVGGQYLALLVVEVGEAVAELRAASRPPGSGRGGAAP